MKDINILECYRYLRRTIGFNLPNWIMITIITIILTVLLVMFFLKAYYMLSPPIIKIIKNTIIKRQGKKEEMVIVKKPDGTRTIAIRWNAKGKKWKIVKPTKEEKIHIEDQKHFDNLRKEYKLPS